MKRYVTCPIDKVKELILTAHPLYYHCNEKIQMQYIAQFVKPMHHNVMKDFMDIKEVTSEEAEGIIETREPIGAFYRCEKNGIHVGIDNSSGDAWVEEFTDKDKCLDWLLGYDEEDEEE